MNDTPQTDVGVQRDNYKEMWESRGEEIYQLQAERDRARKLLAEMKSALKWAKDEAKERLHRLDSAACERRTWLEAHHEMKMQRDALKELSIQLAKELVSKCSDPVHRHQVSQLQEVDDYFKYRPKTMCTSDSANC
jgi:flagellar biosynthesis regulator FlaF